MKKISKVSIFFALIFGLLLFLTYIVSEARKKGETHEQLEEVIAERLIDSIKLKLEIFKQSNGHYPITNSTKYYLDSIGGSDFVDKVYLYSDSIGQFIGVGRSDQYINYECTDGINYKLKLIYHNKRE